MPRPSSSLLGTYSVSDPSSTIGSGHLLLGLLVENEGVAADILTRLGIDGECGAGCGGRARAGGRVV
ncbi:Clp protease N-terminal domain-containing protein [Frankia sp. QA3]|uniref:Clp protease N-terminal domain-containing protein n=1 Tax=Frankia sp. QA3 TaxID=710111 RepID=UPI00056D4F49|nr:Clp protease N-terminal domain-containing protein [Frankia sp. QA3]